MVIAIFSTEMLLLGVDWQQQVDAEISVARKNINIKGSNGYTDIPVETTLGDTIWIMNYQNPKMNMNMKID